MRNILSKLLAIGLLGGGFTATGDLGWLARRGMQLLEASGVPSEAAGLVDTAAAEGPEPQPSDMESASQEGRPAAVRPAAPPPGGPATVDLQSVGPGGRVFVWVTTPGSQAPERLTLDLIDPATGAALLHRDGSPSRRVLVVTAAAGMLASRDASAPTLAVRAPLVVRPLGLAHGATGQAETCGRIAALAVGH